MAEGIPTTPPLDSEAASSGFDPGQTIDLVGPGQAANKAAAEAAMAMRDTHPNPSAESASPWATVETTAESSVPPVEIDTRDSTWVQGAAKKSWDEAAAAEKYGDRTVGVFDSDKLGEFSKKGFTAESLAKLAQKAAEDALKGTGGSNLARDFNRTIRGSEDPRQEEMRKAAEQAMRYREQNLDENASPWAS
jgi:hypothetical protein